MAEVFTVKVCHLDGTVLWAGVVPAEDVVIERPPNAPATCTIKTRMLDALQYLQHRPA